MINWVYFPKKRPDSVFVLVMQAFQVVADDIDSTTHDKQVSDEVLEKVRPELKKCCFTVEKSKKEDKISAPVLFGANGKIEKSFDADAYYDEAIRDRD